MIQRPADSLVSQPTSTATTERTGRRWLWLGVALIAAFVLMYILAWSEAYALSSRYLADADASYNAGVYLDALVGYEAFDAARNAYVQHGGYMQVERIWSGPYAWPVPEGVARARVRIDEIIHERLTVSDVEQFIQANFGKSNPYFGLMYLRLGELYEAEGDVDSALEVYAEIHELFPNEPALIARANQHLARLGVEAK